VEPELRDARVLRHTVGLRPGRPTVRLEVEPRPDGARVIHSYGHGGSGATVCWGCADNVLSLAQPVAGGR
jgi:D-amino-acid oxidase